MSYTQRPNKDNPNDIDFSITAKASTVPYIWTWDWQVLRFFRVDRHRPGVNGCTKETQKQVALESIYIDTPPILPTAIFSVRSHGFDWGWIAPIEHWQEWEDVDTALEAFSQSHHEPLSILYAIKADAGVEVRIDITTN